MKRRAPTTDRAALVAEIAGLSKLGTKELSERWKSLYGGGRSMAANHQDASVATC